MTRLGTSVYGRAFSFIYGREWAGFSRKVAPGVGRLLRDHGVFRGRVVDLGSGTGILAAYLAKKGYEVLGIDRSPWMVAQARRTAPRAEFKVGDLRTIRLHPAESVVSTFDTLNYVRTDAELRKLFGRVHRILKPGGVFVFDLNTLEDLRKGPQVRTVAKRGIDYAAIMRVLRPPRGRLKRYEISTFVRQGRWYSRSEEIHVQLLFTPRTVLRWLRAAGFRARKLRTYPGAPIEPGRSVFVATRPP